MDWTSFSENYIYCSCQSCQTLSAFGSHRRSLKDHLLSLTFWILSERRRCGTLRDIAGHLDCNWSPRQSLATHATHWHCTGNALPHSGFGNGSQWKDPSWRVPTSVQQPLYNLVPFFTYLTCKLFAVNTLRYATSMRPKKQEQKDWDQSAVSKTFAAGGKLGTWSTPALHFVLPTAECVGVGDDWNTSTFIGRKRSSFATRRTPTRINLVSPSKNYWHDSGLTQVSTAWGFKIYDSGLATRPTAGSMS